MFGVAVVVGKERRMRQRINGWMVMQHHSGGHPLFRSAKLIENVPSEYFAALMGIFDAAADASSLLP